MKKTVPDKIRIPEALWTGLKGVGISRADVVRTTQLPITAIRDGAPISTAQFCGLWSSLVDISNDPAIGLRIATLQEGSAMPPSFLAAYYARDFRDALQRVARFKRLCVPEEVLLQEHGLHCEIVVNWLHAEEREVPPALIDATLASLFELGKRGTAQGLTAVAVDLMCSESSRVLYESYYGCKVRFAAKRNCLTLRRSDLNKSFVSYNAELLDILLPELDRRLQQQALSASLTEPIRWVLRRRLAAGRPDVRSIATELAMSERSLQRKLNDEGLTFQRLLGDTRHQLALEYLTDPTLSLMEVAYMLGYEDQNSFFRAFRQWEDSTPTCWRESNQKIIKGQKY
ncbi:MULTISPECIES: AraC family transcriptional regulator [unclassified Pseudomonas]|uniref:AraC family transcriptional regulator n=1 Tax=unclassified Pseudomonas TaxID=196821 RepID=UPI002E7FEA74|nr:MULTISPECIES: AraC family transcriptional regulator ligand-binding domain-containing protein [unclassified Pseudomonas]